jgi:predicted DNA-binding transcriptional regulator
MPAGKNNYSPEEEKILLEMRSAGKSNYEIALTLGRSQDSVKCRVKALIRKGLTASRRLNTDRYAGGCGFRRWTDEDVKELKRLRKSGETCTEIAHKLNRTLDSIQQRSIRLMRENDAIKNRNTPKDTKNYDLNSDLAKTGLLLWWAEGTKKGRNVQFVNSSPDMIRIYVFFLRSIGVVPEKLSAKVKVMNSWQVNESQNYWSKLTGIPLENFTKPIVRGKNVEEKYKEHKGCLTITYCSINLKRQMETKIEEIKKRILNNSQA